MIMADPNKVRISREILSDGPGYKAYPQHRSFRNGEETTKRHMGKYVEGMYIPTSPEWEPPDYLMGKQWRIVNEAGNTVGLKAYVPPLARRHLYTDEVIKRHEERREERRREFDRDSHFEVFLKGSRHTVLFRWPFWRRRPSRSALLVREVSLKERLLWRLRRFCGFDVHE